MLFRDFRNAYPDLWRYGTRYQLDGYMKILISIPTVGKLIYDYFGDKITWLEVWDDPKEIKRIEAEKRDRDYSYFLFAVQDRMDALDLSQGDVADITGYSRVSINKYLTGRTIPRLSTMIDITTALGIDDF